MYCTHWKMSPGDVVEIIGAIFRAHFRYLRCRTYRIESQPQFECSPLGGAPTVLCKTCNRGYGEVGGGGVLPGNV